MAPRILKVISTKEALNGRDLRETRSEEVSASSVPYCIELVRKKSHKYACDIRVPKNEEKMKPNG
eukprot:scaffold674_cov130-Amphora_coffeaeformis.AAC.2